MASISTTTPGDRASSSGIHDTLNLRNVTSRPSSQKDELLLTVDTVTVTSRDEPNTSNAGTEISELAPLAPSDEIGSHLRIDALQSTGSQSVSSLQTLTTKLKLVRCQTVFDDVSLSTPPPLPVELIDKACIVTSEPLEKDSSAATIHSSVSRLNGLQTLQTNPADGTNHGQSGSQGSTVSENGPSPAMSRDSSVENANTDSAGAKLEDFIIKTLNKNKSDRLFMLQLEADMINFIGDVGKNKWIFAPMTSYLRMLVHRVAAFFGLDHNVDEHGKCVIISRLPNSRIPDFKFREHLRDDFLSEDQSKKSILKRHRDFTSLENNHGFNRITLGERGTKSFEEKTEEYSESRGRIFRKVPNGRSDSSSPANKNEGMLRSKEGHTSCNYSTDSSQSCAVTSFHSVVVTGGDGLARNLSSGSPSLKTDSVISAVSGPHGALTLPPTDPSSSLPSDGEAGGDGPSAGSPFLSFTDDHGEPLAIWVASSISQIPPGSFIIDPKKGEPYMNPDGSMYRWLPPKPLRLKNESTDGSTSALDREVDAAINEKSSWESSPMSQEFLEASTCRASEATRLPAVLAQSQRVPQPQTSTVTSSSSGPSSSADATGTSSAMLPTPLSGKTRSEFQPDTTMSGISASNRHLEPPPAIVPAYNGSTVPIPVHPVHFVSPQVVAYPTAQGASDQLSSAPEGSCYGYNPTYPKDSFQVANFPPAGIPLPPAESFQQMQTHVVPQPVAVVQYADKAWNQYPLTLVPGRSSVTGQMYYAVDSSLGSPGAISGHSHQYPFQFVVVSSASTVDHSQPVMFTSQASMLSGGVMANALQTYIGSGPPLSTTQPQYFQYAYHQPLGGTALPVMPLYPNMMTAPVPSTVAPSGPAPCLVPVVHPPVGGRSSSHRSSSPKSFPFSVPPPANNFNVRTTAAEFPVRSQGTNSLTTRSRAGLGQGQLSNRPMVKPHQPRFGLGGDSSFPRMAQQRMIPPSLPSNFHQKPSLTVTNVKDNSGVLASSEIRNSTAVTQSRVGVTTEGSKVLEVFGVPPAISRQKVSSYLADLRHFGAKEFHVQDDPQVTPKDGACVGSAAILAVFDSVVNAQRALRDHRGNGYRLQKTTRTYNLNRRS